MISRQLRSGAGAAARSGAQWKPFCPLRPPQRSGGQGPARAAVVARSVKAADLLRRANEKYTAKDLMGAAKLYEDVLAQDDVTTRQRQAALFGSTAVHASFGDIELAQITLREGIRAGLDFDQALADPDLPDLITSPQMLIQLRRFNQVAQGALAQRASSPGQLGREFRHILGLDGAIPGDSGAARGRCAAGKNRYANVLPYDHNRVLLGGAPGPRDYINASRLELGLPGHDAPGSYIATQGPLPGTAGDFWAMVYEAASPAVVMLTNTAEGGMTKCAQYFPPAPPQQQRPGGGSWPGRAEVEAALDLPHLVHELRRQRAGMVQTPEQYAFVYRCLLDDLDQRLAGGADDAAADPAA